MKTLYRTTRVCASTTANPLRRSGFTMIEILVVITIIAILMGLLGNAYVQARNHAKRGRAETQLRELVKAWSEYYMTYTNWPASPATPNLRGQVNVLMTYENLEPLFAKKLMPDGSLDPNPNNTKAIPFLSIKLQPGETYCDPWKNPYKISFKTGADNQETAMRITVGFPNRDRYR